MRHGHAAQDPLPGDHPPTGVKVENAGGVQTLEADTVLFALGMKSVDIAPLKAAAEAAGLKTWVIGDAIQPGKVDQATRSAYLAGIEVGRWSPPPWNKSTPPAKPEGFCLSEKRQEPLFEGDARKMNLDSRRKSRLILRGVSFPGACPRK